MCGGNGVCAASVLGLSETWVVFPVPLFTVTGFGSVVCLLFVPGCVDSEWVCFVPSCVISTSSVSHVFVLRSCLVVSDAPCDFTSGVDSAGGVGKFCAGLSEEVDRRSLPCSVHLCNLYCWQLVRGHELAKCSTILHPRLTTWAPGVHIVHPYGLVVDYFFSQYLRSDRSFHGYFNVTRSEQREGRAGCQRV